MKKLLILALFAILPWTLSTQTFVGRTARPPLNPPPVTLTNVEPDLLWWAMEENGGTSFSAKSPTTVTGTHDADYATGEGGASLYAGDFNGTSDDATSDSNLAITGTNIITVCAFLKFDTTANCILWTSCADPYGACNNQQFFMTLESSIFYFAVQDSATGRRRSTLSLASSGISTGVWYHWMTVFDQAANSSKGKVSVYINGVPKTMTNETETDTKTLNSNFAAVSLKFGQRSAPDRWFDGKVDDLRIYSGDQSTYVTNILQNPF